MRVLLAAVQTSPAPTPWVEVMVAILGGYLLAGVGFGLLFAAGNGARRIDPAAAHASPGFRFIVFPGVAIFWPYLLFRWLRATAPPEETSAHRQIPHGS